MPARTDLTFLRRISIAILALWLVQGSASAPAQSLLPSPEEVHFLANKIKGTAQEIKYAPWAKFGIMRPEIRSNPYERKKLIYNFGYVDLTILGFTAGDPWRVPYEMQIRIELFNDLFRKISGAWPVWEPYRQRAETLVLAAIGDVLITVRDPNEFRLFTDIWHGPQGKLAKREAQFRTLIDEDLPQALKAFFAAQGYNFIEEGGYGGGVEETRPKVRITTEPPGGKVKVLPYIIYRRNQDTRKNPDQWSWQTLEGSTELLIGKYVYVAVWPRGQYDEGSFEVLQDKTITFRPGNR